MSVHTSPGLLGVGIKVGVGVFAGAHTGGLPGWQLPVTQSESLLQPPPWGTSGMHVPGWPVMSQRWPVGQEATLQQIPSVQKPETQLALLPQVLPLGAGVWVAAGVWVRVGVTVAEGVGLGAGRVTHTPSCGSTPQDCPVAQ